MKKIFLLMLFVSFVSCGGGDDDENGNESEVVETIPVLSTKPILNIETDSATSGGAISSDGNSQVLQKGVCWSKSPNPTITGSIANDFSVDGNGDQSYVSELTQLEPNTTYYTRAYATNSIGTGYGNQISFSTIGGTNSEDTFNGSIDLFTQAEVDAFGANNYTHVTGRLYIGSNPSAYTTNITNLDALNSLVSVAVLTMEDNNLLENLDPLTNLISVGALIIIDNGLLNIDGLTNLTEILFLLNISNNDSLTNIDGLDSLTIVNTKLEITQNDVLTNLNGLTNLISVGTVTNPPTPYTKGFTISANNMLTDLDGLDSLLTVGGDLYIYQNNSLVDLEGLSNLNSVGWVLQIRGNNMLTNLNGLSNIPSVRSLIVMDNQSLLSLDGLEGLSSLEENVYIKNNTLLNDFCGIQSPFFNGLIGIYDVIDNTYNPTLQDLIDGNCSL
jgi:hypothetical protein